MKCSNCNREIENPGSFCPFCGAKLEIQQEQNQLDEQTTEVNNEPVNEIKETINDTVNENATNNVTIKEEVNYVQNPVDDSNSTIMQETTTTVIKNKRPSIITIAVILALVVIIVIVGCVIAFSGRSGEALYKNVIKYGLNEAFAGKAVTSNSANIKASVGIKTDIAELKDYIDGIALGVNVQYDIPNRKAVLGLDVAKNSDAYINAKAMVDLINSEAYVSESNLYDKTVRVAIPDGAIDENVDFDSLKINKAVGKKIAKKINKAIDKNLTKEYFRKEKVTLNVDGKEKQVKDSILSMTTEQFTQLVKEVVNSLKMDNDFLACFKDRDEIIGVLDEIEDNAESLEGEEYVIHFYTSGMTNSFVGISIVFKEYEGYEEIIDISKTQKDTYKVELKTVDNGTTQVVGKSTITIIKNTGKEKMFNVAFDMSDVGSMNINLSLSQVYNRGVEEISTVNVVNYEEMNEEDVQQIYSNLMESKIYELVTTFSKNSGLDIGLGNSGSSNVGNREIPVGIDLKSNQSFVESYDEDVIVFDVPATLDVEYSGASYQRFSKEEKSKDIAYVDVDCNWASLESYEDNLKGNVEYYSSNGGYRNVNLSDKEEVKVGNNTFYKRIFKYTYGSEPYSYTRTKVYYYTPINEEYVYSVEIDDDDGIVSQKEVDKLLTVSIHLKNRE